MRRPLVDSGSRSEFNPEFVAWACQSPRCRRSWGAAIGLRGLSMRVERKHRAMNRAAPIGSAPIVNLRASLIALAAALSAAPAHAQDDGAPVRLDTIEVQGRGLKAQTATGPIDGYNATVSNVGT